MKYFLLTIVMLVSLLTNPSFAQTQSDSSDAVWSIVIPQSTAYDIDMKQCLVGLGKDSMITPFISNIGSYKFRVDSVYFTGGDASCFSMVSGFPQYEVAPSASHQAELRFVPNRIGIHTAQIVIITQSDTLTKNIIGEGVEKQFSILTDLLDFGRIEIGNDKTFQDTALLKNISTSSLTINNVVQLGPDLTQFEIVDGGGSFTLAPGEVRKLSIKFKPKYGGRTSGQIGFEFSGTGSPAIARLFGTGIGGEISVADDSAFVGEKKLLKIILGNIKPEGIAEICPVFEATLRFHSSILAPQSGNFTINNDSIFLKVNGTINSSVIIAEIPVVAGLGSVEETSLDVTEFVFKDNAGELVEFDVEKQSGIFKLLGICEEGGKRMFLSNGSKTALLSIIPNPADGEINITVNTIEQGESYIYVYNNVGMEIYKNKISNSEIGRKEVKVNTSNFTNGVYFIKLQTPTYNEYQKLIIGR